MELRNDWTREEIKKIYEKPFLDLIYEAQTIHRQYFKAGEVQKSTLLSIKTGGCSEDCSYCSQSAHSKTDVERHDVLSKDVVLQKAKQAKEEGSTRFCMGAAWGCAPEGEKFNQVLDLVKGVAQLGMEVCCTLGMLTPAQAASLKEAGLTAYNHNLDTSPEYYDKIITTRTYQDRLDTINNVREAGIEVCSGGIVGLGESKADRIGLLHSLATQEKHPDSVPINMLVSVKGTPLQNQAPLDPKEFIRMIATARIIMPQSFVRLSAGRRSLSQEAQALAFLAGANSIFAGDKLLTTPNPQESEDKQLFETLGLEEMPLREDIPLKRAWSV